MNPNKLKKIEKRFHYSIRIVFVEAAQESQRNRNITAWFSSSGPALFFAGFHLSNNLVETFSRSVVLKDCNLKFWTGLIEVKNIHSDKLYPISC